MSKSIISEGKTTNEAIEKGLKELKVKKDMVDIKVLENEQKRNFFNILTPRVVKVELTLKETEFKPIKEKRKVNISEEELNQAKQNVENFLKEFESNLLEKSEYKVTIEDKDILVTITGENIGFLIGYRGETLYSMQTILSEIANKNIKNRARVLLNIAGYREKREKTLEELAEKIAKTVIRTGKSITLEPMQAYERKIIHSKLQEHRKVSTKSIGDEPKRKIIVSLNK